MEKEGFSEIRRVDITKADVVNALRKAKEAGILEPDSTTNPEAKEIQQLVTDYRKKLDEDAKKIGTIEANLLANFEKTIIHVDSGYDDDPIYVDEVIEWLNQDLATAEGLGELKVTEKIKAKMTELEKKIILR